MRRQPGVRQVPGLGLPDLRAFALHEARLVGGTRPREARRHAEDLEGRRILVLLRPDTARRRQALSEPARGVPQLRECPQAGGRYGDWRRRRALSLLPHQPALRGILGTGRLRWRQFGRMQRGAPQDRARGGHGAVGSAVGRPDQELARRHRQGRLLRHLLRHRQGNPQAGVRAHARGDGQIPQDPRLDEGLHRGTHRHAGWGGAQPEALAGSRRLGGRGDDRETRHRQGQAGRRRRGAARPVSANDTEAGRAKNRRVEMVLR